MLVATKYAKHFGPQEIADEDLRIILNSEGGFPIIIRYVGDNKKVRFLKKGYYLIWNWERSFYFIYRSLDNAMRYGTHAKAKYGRGDQRDGGQGELAELSTIVQRHGMLWDLVADWKNLSPAKREAFTQASLATAEALKKARNHLRVGMAERSTMASTIIDSRGQTNPSRTEALHATVRDHAKRRVIDIRSITVHTDRRQSALFDENERNLDILRQATAISKELIGYREIKEINGAIERMKALFVQVDDIPYIHLFRRCLRNDLEPALLSLRGGRSADAYKRIQRTYESFQVFWFSRELSELRLRLAFALSRRPRRSPELSALKTEFEAFVNEVETAQVKGLDKDLRNSPLSRVVQHIFVALLEWELGDFSAVADELDEAEETF